MLHYAVVFFVIALIAALLGFRGVAGMSAEIGWFFAVLAVIFLVVALVSGRPAVVGSRTDRQFTVSVRSFDSLATTISHVRRLAS